MEKVVYHLNILLADLNVFYRMLQNYHWNIEGDEFFWVHEKLEEYYDAIHEQIDEIAEHILILGEEPLGTLKDYLEKTTLKEAENKKIKEDKVFKSIMEDFANLKLEVLTIKKEADKEEDTFGTSALMDEYILKYSKILWMLRQRMGE